MFLDGEKSSPETFQNTEENFSAVSWHVMESVQQQSSPQRVKNSPQVSLKDIYRSCCLSRTLTGTVLPLYPSFS